jgi:hypothetical protein
MYELLLLVSLSIREVLLVFPKYLKKLINAPFLLPKGRQL